MATDQIIAYHGTTRTNAESIAEKGFRVGTYFAYDIDDALYFGGPFVFAAKFQASGFRGLSDGWQFHLRDPLSPKSILWLRNPNG